MDRILATASLPATVGEWVQGWIGGRESLVSLVAGWDGRVELRASGGGASTAGSKALRAFSVSKEMYGASSGFNPIPEGSVVNVVNPHPSAKGLATSTMDIAGAFAACAAYAGDPMTEERLFSLCASLEASDGIMFGGLALVDHINGRLVERLPSPPEMTILVIIPEGALDTSDYRRDDARMERVRAMADAHESAYGMLKKGLLAQDPAMVAAAATMSAAAQQSVMPRDEWDLLLDICSSSGALGVAVAHSGTVSGLLYSPENVAGADSGEDRLRSALGEVAGERAAIKRTYASSGWFRAERRG
ncbi:MAG: GHMP kinase [Synergistaceae bacterium]|jgi:L-threonine kinase|nr:GHMP kinase [Synergistaceae bacterium]